MPDANHRASYDLYVRDAFQRNANLPSTSREAILAYRDGLDQVEQMEYYHKMKMKQNQKHAHLVSASPHQEVVAASPKSNYASSVHDNAKEIEEWLLKHLPHLGREDLEEYSKHLVADGFDSLKIIEQELLTEDLSFMKKGHRRVIERQLKGIRGSS